MGIKDRILGLFPKRNASHVPTMFTHVDFPKGVGDDATALAAMDMIASGLATLNFSFFGRKDRQALKDHHLHRLLKNPNIDETQFVFMYGSVMDYFKAGNVYWYGHANDSGETVALYRLDPNKVTVRRGESGLKVFTHEGREYGGDRIVHIASRHGYDGLKGSPIATVAGEVFRLSRRLDEFVETSFDNGVGSRLVVDIEEFRGKATQEEVDQMSEMFLSKYSGARNAGRPLIRQKGIAFSTLDSKPNTSQSNELLSNRKFSEQEIAKLFGVPLPLLNGTDTAHIESLYISYIEKAILPIASQFQDAINARLIPRHQRGRIFFEYNYNSLLKTSTRDKNTSYNQQISMGIMSINEARRKENLPPIEAGDTNFVPGNWMPLTPETVDSYMAGAKLKLWEYENMNTHSPGVSGNHSNLGDDKA